MSRAAAALLTIPVGVIVGRRGTDSPWIDFVWTASGVLHGEPGAAPWTVLNETAGVTTFYAGAAEIELYRTETTHYRDNIASGSPGVWVVLSPTDADPPYRIVTVTADPAEGEGLTEGSGVVVEQVPMPPSILDIVTAFVAEHHVERQFVKRQRDRADPEALARRGYGDHDE